MAQVVRHTSTLKFTTQRGLFWRASIGDVMGHIDLRTLSVSPTVPDLNGWFVRRVARLVKSDNRDHGVMFGPARMTPPASHPRLITYPEYPLLGGGVFATGIGAESTLADGSKIHESHVVFVALTGDPDGAREYSVHKGPCGFYDPDDNTRWKPYVLSDTSYAVSPMATVEGLEMIWQIDFEKP